MFFMLLAHGEIVQHALDKEAVPQLLEDAEDGRIGTLEKTKREGGKQPQARERVLVEGSAEIPIPPSEAFQNVREAFERWLATRGFTLRQQESGVTEKVGGVEGPEMILYDKMTALQRAYDQNPRMLPEALKRFESTLDILRHEVPQAKEELRFQRERSEQYAQSAANVLRELTRARLEGRLAERDYETIQQILDVTSKVETARGLEQRQARESLLQAAESLVSYVRPEVEEWSTISREERWGELQATRQAVVEKMRATQNNDELVKLVRQFETLTEQISRLEAQKGPKLSRKTYDTGATKTVPIQ